MKTPHLSAGLFLALCLSPIFLFSQSTFHAGYVITPYGDTLHGAIDYRNEILANEQCNFRQSGQAKAKTFDPDGLILYRYEDGRTFISKPYKGRRKFLRLLFKGEVNLYVYHQEDGAIYFLENQQLGIQPIPYEEKPFVEPARITYLKSKKHFAVLQAYFQDDPALLKAIGKIETPTQKNLLALVSTYHASKSEVEPLFLQDKNRGILVQAEVVFGNQQFHQTTELFNPSQDPGGQLIGGVNLTFAQPRMNDILFIRTGILLSNYQESPLNPGREMGGYKIPLQLGFTYLFPWGAPSIAAGYYFYNPSATTFSFQADLSLAISPQAKAGLRIEPEFATNGVWLPRSYLATSTFLVLTFELVRY